MPWRHDTLVDFYSVGKAFVALLALQLVDAGRVGLDQPIVAVWPEFAAAGKEGTTLRHTLCHRAGVPAIREPLTNDDLWDWSTMAGALAATEPWWEPGTRHAYHTNTYGHLIGEVVRRVAARRAAPSRRACRPPRRGRARRGPTGGAAPLRRRALRRARPLPRPPDRLARGRHPHGDAELLQPPGLLVHGRRQHPGWRGAEVPSTNGHGSARVWRACTRRCSSPAGCSRPTCSPRRPPPQSEGYCPILHEEVTFGLGFKPAVPRRPLAPIRGASAISARGGRSGSPIPAAASRSATS